MGRVIPIMGSRKVFNITYMTPLETLEGTPITLPTTEPTTPQVNYTVDVAHYPVFSVNLFSVKYIAVLYGAGKFVTAGTLSWRMKKNGASVTTGTASVAANTFYTVNAFFLDVVAGDVLEIALWSNQTDSNYDYKALWLNFTRPFIVNPLNNTQIIAYFSVTCTTVAQPTLTLGNPLKETSNYPIWIYDAEGLNTLILASGDGPWTGKWRTMHATYGLYRYGYWGDQNNSNTAVVKTDATYRPKQWANWIIIELEGRSFRCLM